MVKVNVSVKSMKKEEILIAGGGRERWFGEGNGVAVI